MGQYYKAIILAEENAHTHEIIRAFVLAFTGLKLTEHSYIDDEFVKTVESLLTPEGMFYKSRLVWAGDYADPEQNQVGNLYHIANTYNQKQINTETMVTSEYTYILNHTKRQYINKAKCKNMIHPLPLLTAEGNGRGGGDYYEKGIEYVGTWARDVISVEKMPTDGYTELKYEFGEYDIV